jgi:predicted RNA-binding protein with PIN domain
MGNERLIVIDGYNVILRAPHLRPGPDRTLREAREKLLNLLSWAVGSGDATFLVVFDGAQGGGRDTHQGRVDIRYSHPPEKADDVIRRVVEDQVDRVDRLTVVTADIEVARHARAMGADIVLSDLFLASVMGPTSEAATGADADEKPVMLSKKEIEEWSEIFIRKRSSDKEPNGADEDA